VNPHEQRDYRAGEEPDRGAFLLSGGEGRAWLCAVGTADEKEKAKALVAELEEDIMPIDGLIGFAASDMGAKVFGEEKAKEVLAHAEAIKAAGAKYCDCPACAACEAILKHKEELIG